MADQLLGSVKTIPKFRNWVQRQTEYLGTNPLICKLCGSLMVFKSREIPTPISIVKLNLMAKFWL
jgi:hypothetical protein